MRFLRWLWAILRRMFRRPPPLRTRALPPGYQWVGHPGTRSQLRLMRQSARRVVALARGDWDARNTMNRLSRVAEDQPNPTLAALRIAHISLQMADGLTREGTPTTWAQAADRVLDGIEG